MILKKLEIIDRVYKKGPKYDGMLMACYSAGETFKYNIISVRVRNYHPSSTSISTTLNDLVRSKFVEVIEKDGKMNVYKVTNAGIDRLSSLYPEEFNEINDLQNASSINVNREYEYFLKTSKTVSERRITEKCKELNRTLLNKNRRYGDSSLTPFGLFPSGRTSKIEARIEDKLSRIHNMVHDKHSQDYMDAVRDLTGYLILYDIVLSEGRE